MSPIICHHRDAIAEVRRRYAVKRLELFGSAASGAFDTQSSDFDFFVEFESYGKGISDRWFTTRRDFLRQ